MMTRKKWLPYLLKKLLIVLASVLALSVIVFAVFAGFDVTTAAGAGFQTFAFLFGRAVAT